MCMCVPIFARWLHTTQNYIPFFACWGKTHWMKSSALSIPLSWWCVRNNTYFASSLQQRIQLANSPPKGDTSGAHPEEVLLVNFPSHVSLDRVRDWGQLAADFLLKCCWFCANSPRWNSSQSFAWLQLPRAAIAYIWHTSSFSALARLGIRGVHPVLSCFWMGYRALVRVFVIVLVFWYSSILYTV